MSGRSAFHIDLKAIPRYLMNGPAHIGEVLAKEGPTAASRSARFYSLALLLTVFAIYMLMACSLGAFSIPMKAADGRLMLSDPPVLVFVILAGAVMLGAIIAALWAAVLGIMGMFSQREDVGRRLSAMLWGLALLPFYGGVIAGILGYA